MTRILVVNTPGLANRGSEAVVRGAINCIRTSMPDSRITFLCHHFDADKDTFASIAAEDPMIRMIRHPWYRESGSRAVTAVHSGLRFIVSAVECATLRVATRLGLKSRNPFYDCDLVLDLNTDALNEYYHGAFAPVFVLANIALGILASKPLAVCAASIAPFEKRRSLNVLLRSTLNRAKLITVRDEFSLEHLKETGVTKPRVRLTADLSLLLSACSHQHATEIMIREGFDTHRDPLIGVAVAHQSLFSDPTRFLDLMAAASDSLAKEMNASLVFIPNSFSAGPYDEAATIQEILGRTTTKERIGRIRGEYSAAEMKGIISRCDLLVSAKFHPLLFAASMGIPSVGIVGYHKYKFHGVMGRMLGQEDYLVDIDDFADNELLQAALLTKVRLAWQNREAMRQDLAARVETARRMAYLNGELIKESLEGAQGRSPDC
ncbi:MAG: polysaccharide pyruvyl transferase family protein [Dehalococcoidia bacterium]|nr:polysaccharide pyruvyl transferase family protein [Dehalococcoidia bacterium]